MLFHKNVLFMTVFTVSISNVMSQDMDYKSILDNNNNHIYDEDDIKYLPLLTLLGNNKKYISHAFDCSYKLDDGYYEHRDCKKYWHCLYVGTVFELSLERKCPPGTMFHPMQGFCEMSNLKNCSSWRKSIYGTYYIDPQDVIETTKIVETTKDLTTETKEDSTTTTKIQVTDEIITTTATTTTVTKIPENGKASSDYYILYIQFPNSTIIANTTSVVNESSILISKIMNSTVILTSEMPINETSTPMTTTTTTTNLIFNLLNTDDDTQKGRIIKLNTINDNLIENLTNTAYSKNDQMALVSSTYTHKCDLILAFLLLPLAFLNI